MNRHRSSQGAAFPAPPSAASALLHACVRQACATPGEAPAAAPDAATCTASDWARAVDEARRHSVLPLLREYLEATRPLHVPAATRAEITRRVEGSAARNLFLAADCLDILDLADRENIPLLPYKGPVIAETLYGDVRRRPFSDLDFLVAGADLHRLRATLAAHGYEPFPALRAAEEDAYERLGFDWIFRRLDGRVRVDVRTAVLPGFLRKRLGVEELRARFVEGPFAGRTVRALAPEDLLLVLVAHGGKHIWCRWLWLCDIGRLLRRFPALDWDVLRDRAARTGTLRMLHVGLLLAHDLLHAPVPTELLREAESDPTLPRLAEHVRRRLFTPGLGDPTAAETTLFHLRLTDGGRDRVYYCAHQLCVPGPGDWTALPLPRALFPLYYLTRPFRLIVQTLRRICRAAIAGGVAPGSSSD